MPVGGTAPCWGEAIKAGSRDKAHRKEKTEEQGQACRYLGSGLERNSVGSRTRRINHGRLPRGGEYGIILQGIERLVCRERRREDGSDWGQTRRLGAGQEAEYWAVWQGGAERPDPGSLWREGGKDQEQVSVGGRP